MMRTLQLLSLGFLGLALGQPAPAQPPAKRPLTHQDYAAWRSIEAPTLSADGTYMAMVLAPQESDGEFVVRHLVTGKEYRQPRGSRPEKVETPPPTTVRRSSRITPRAESSPHPFSPDGRFALFSIFPGKAEATRGKANPAASAALGILELSTGKLTRIERVRTFAVPEEGPGLVVYLRGPEPAGPPSPTKGKEASPPAPPPGELVVRSLADGKERVLGPVAEFSLARDGKALAYAVAGKDDSASSVQVVAPVLTGSPVLLASGGRGSRLTWDEGQQQLAFLRSRSAADGKGPSEVRLCHWKLSGGPSPKIMAMPMLAPALTGLALAAAPISLPVATVLTLPARADLRPGMEVSDQGELEFSPDGKSLYFQVSPPPVRPAPPGEEKAVFEMWHYRDDYIQPIQKVRYVARPAYRAVFLLDTGTCRQLADEEFTQVQPAAQGDWVIALDERPYRAVVGSESVAASSDVYLLHARTGEKKLVARNQAHPPSFSPRGNYLLTFDGKDWHAVSVSTGQRVNLTAKLGVSFVDEQHDQPSDPPPYGFAGWTADDRHVLLYDRYDIWQVPVDGSTAKNLTESIGRKAGTQLRIVRLDPRQRSFDPAQPLLARAEKESTRDTGFYRLALSGATPRLLVMGARNHGIPQKAPRGDRLLLTVSTFYDYPDLYSADLDFRELRRVSNANPQKAGLLWGRAELVKYRSADGVPLQGMLIRPENFDPTRKYPLMVYIYERLSQNLHRFVDPRPGTSINPTYYASNGYMVLMPDIVYTVGAPGQSALKCVLPAVQAVVDLGGVDENAIGLQGHSWGGYQTAYLITQTTRFKAASAGAPVANMTSAYGGIRWGSGLPRQFQYEKTQSRLGATLWQAMGRFVENSPLFYADRIRTPLLMLHNDRDEAVPWQQGIEFYLALRRLGKEVYLFNYPGEFHGLRRRVNQKDYTVRLQQFFDHHLKGAPRPEWMAKGIPYTPPPATPAEPGRRARPTTTPQTEGSE
ncbi:MAG: prolyl oligopeptidase family serine peptidase [Gemmataceae bacterium]